MNGTQEDSDPSTNSIRQDYDPFPGAIANETNCRKIQATIISLTDIIKRNIFRILLYLLRTMRSGDMQSLSPPPFVIPLLFSNERSTT